MVPSWRLAEEAEKRRLLQAENLVLKARIAELERVIKAARLALSGSVSLLLSLEVHCLAKPLHCLPYLY